MTSPPGACSLTILVSPHSRGLVNIDRNWRSKSFIGFEFPFRVTVRLQRLLIHCSHITKRKKRAPSVVYRDYLVSAQDPVFRGCVRLDPCLPTGGRCEALPVKCGDWAGYALPFVYHTIPRCEPIICSGEARLSDPALSYVVSRKFLHDRFPIARDPSPTAAAVTQATTLVFTAQDGNRKLNRI